MSTVTDDKFPCPICSQPLVVKLTKKDKPYLICDPCGVQIFVRGPTGIHEFKRLLERGSRNGTMGRLEEMEKPRMACVAVSPPLFISPMNSAPQCG
jgi:hypothetical protein